MNKSMSLILNPSQRCSRRLEDAGAILSHVSVHVSCWSVLESDIEHRGAVHICSLCCALTSLQERMKERISQRGSIKYYICSAQ